MLRRIKTSVVLVVALVVILMFSDTPVLNVAVALVSLVAVRELYNASLKDKQPLLLLPGSVFALVYPFGEYLPLPTGLYVYALIVAIFLVVLRHHEEVHVRDGAMAFLCAYLVTVFLTCIVGIGRLPYGEFYVYLVFLIPWASDSLAYLVGSAIGKRKMCPTISPHKTVAGGVAGLTGGPIIVLLFAALMKYVFMAEVSHLAFFVITAAVCSAISEVGDLSASILKRQYGIKDFGHIFPGHGGMMDRFDSVIFVAPVVYYFLSYFPVLG